MDQHAALERFASLARLPLLPSLEEKSRAIALAALASTACKRATVVVFTEVGASYTSVPDGGGFTLRENTRSLQRLFFHALGKYATSAGFFVPSDSSRALAAVSAYQPETNLLILPLETTGSPLGALVLEVDERPEGAAIAELRVFCDLAAWMIAHQRELSSAEREAKQSVLLAMINEHARKLLDRQAILESVVEDVRQSFDAMRCVVYGRDVSDPDFIRVLARAEDARVEQSIGSVIEVTDTWLDRAFAGSMLGREEVGSDPRDALLVHLGVGSALLVPLVIDGRVEHALALHFRTPHAFDEIDMVMLRSVASHVGLALANVYLYDLERLRRARAESLERVVRMLRDTQTMEEVLLVFAVTVSHEVKLTCAAYEMEGGTALRRAVRSVDSARASGPERVEAAQLTLMLDREDLIPSSSLGSALRQDLFGENEGLVAALRVDGNLWGFVCFIAPRGTYDWLDAERRVYFHTLTSHLELALSGALGFERIQQLARALSESNEFKDDLLAMLAHDFKGPLTVILGYCELLLESAPSELLEELETIHSQTKRLVRLSEDAVALAQTQAGGFTLERAALDLRDVVAESVRAHNRADARIGLRNATEPIPVLLDAARFNHVLDNLLMNAIKYSQEEIVVRVTRDGGNGTIAITDRGIGIPAAELGTVFSRFGRASNARRKGISGSGVGLYVSRKIVEVHGGSIAVTSVEGKGSTFTMTLPLAGSPLALQ